MRPSQTIHNFTLPAGSANQSTKFQLEGEYFNALLITSNDIDYSAMGGEITVTESGGTSENEIPLQGIPLRFFGDQTEKTFGTPIDADAVSNQIIIPLGARHTIDQILNVSIKGMENAGASDAFVEVATIVTDDVPEFALKYRLSEQTELTANDVLELHVQGFTPSKANLQACNVNLKYTGQTELNSLAIHNAVEMLASKIENGASSALNSVRVFATNDLPTQVKYNITGMPEGAKVLIVSQYMNFEQVEKSAQAIAERKSREEAKLASSNPEMYQTLNALNS